MTPTKYNPAFQSPEERDRLFAGRHQDLQEILRIVRENTTRQQNQHLVLLGSRGMGKTTLLLRTVDEIRADPALSACWFPIITPEESYRVGTIGEFWLELVYSLARTTSDSGHERAYDALRAAYDSPGSANDDHRLAEAARGYLLDFADQTQRRLVLIVENLQILLGEQLNNADAWALRETLIGEPRMMFLGSAVSRFDEIGEPEAPLYELFLLHLLKPLDTAGCQELWQRLTGHQVPLRRMRAIEILTGGNPRLLAILGEFAGDLSLRDLTNNLAALIDDHTDYLKITTEALPALERKLFVTLAEIWDYASAAEVARQARVELNTASAQLGRLVNRGAVCSRLRGRGKQYRVAERLYSIYHMMRRHGGAAARARAATEFMVAYYESPELAHYVQAIAEEVLDLPSDRRREFLLIVQGLLFSRSLAASRADLLAQLPREIVAWPEAPEALKRLFGPRRAVAGRRPGARRQPGHSAVPPAVRVAITKIQCPQGHATIDDARRALQFLLDAANVATSSAAEPRSFRGRLEKFGSAVESLLGLSLTEMKQVSDSGRTPGARQTPDRERILDYVTGVLHDLRSRILEVVGRHDEARLARSEAVAYLARFARNRAPATGLMFLHALGSLADGLSALGRLEEANDAAHAGLMLADAMKSQEAAIPLALDLALPLQRVAQRLEEGGRRDEGAEILTKTRDLLAQLEQRGIQGTEIAIARFLALRCIHLMTSQVQEVKDVRSTSREAQERLARLADTKPQEFDADLARGTVSAAFLLSTTSEPGLRLPPIATAVDTFRACLHGRWRDAPEWLAMALALHSRALQALGDHEQAIQALSEAITLDASNPHARGYRALAYVETGRHGDALADLRALAAAENERPVRLAMATNVAISLAAAGNTRATLDAIRESAMATFLEPLIVALTKVAGEEVSAPAEIEEVAADIIEQIHARSNQSRPKKPPQWNRAN